jgi:hypothetical protein
MTTRIRLDGGPMMNETDTTGDAICPSCGAPRLAAAWDCGSCGAVFDDPNRQAGREGSQPEPGEAAPAAQPKRSSARRSSSARRPGAGPKIAKRTTGSGLSTLREWVADNKAVAVILSFVVYVVVVWSFGALIIGATDSAGAIKNAYRDVTGRPMPEGFGPTFAAHFVSRKLVVLDRPDQVLLVLYRDEDGASDAELIRFAEGVLDVLEVPWELVRTRSATVAGETIEVPVLRLWGEGGPHAYLIPVGTVDGGRAVEAVVGPPGNVLDVVEEMVRTR